MNNLEITKNSAKILLIQTAFIGDVILATALLEKLHHHFPNASIDFLLRKGNESLLKGHPFVHQVLVWDKKKEKYKGLWRLLQAIRRQKYEYVINLQRFGSTGFLTAFSGGKITVGFDKNPFSSLFNKKITHQMSGLHEVQRNTALVSWFTDEEVFRPKLYAPPLQKKTTQPYVCMAPTSVWFTKQFPESQWIKLIQTIPLTYHIYLLGSPQDKEICERIRTEAGRANVENWTGQCTLLESATLMKGAVMNYVNDSAPMHLCSATNAPVCAIFCSTVPNFGFGPLSDQSFIVETTQKLSCRPCGLHGKKTCPEGHFNCGFGIEIAQLLEHVWDLL